MYCVQSLGMALLTYDKCVKARCGNLKAHFVCAFIAVKELVITERHHYVLVLSTYLLGRDQ